MTNQFPPVETPDYARIRDAFKQELSRAAAGDPSSLPFIRNQLPSHALVEPHEVFQVFVIGGTSGEVATVRYEPGGDIKILEHEAHQELEKFSTSDDFLGFIARNLDKSTGFVGLNFAFTLIPKVGREGQVDGVMVSGHTKGHAFHGLQRVRVGEAIEKYLEAKTGRKVVASVGNDTVCLIASGTGKDTDRTTLAAGIVGTGYNLAFFLDDTTIINVQASDFTGFKPTATGRVVDQASSNTGEQLYNKEVAAGELYKHYNALIARGDLRVPVLRSTRELAEIASFSRGEDGEAARALLHRSASLVAAQLAGLHDFKSRPEKLTMIMQGSLFWHGPGYKEMVAAALAEFGVPAGAIEFTKIPRSDVLGAAKLITGGY